MNLTLSLLIVYPRFCSLKYLPSLLLAANKTETNISNLHLSVFKYKKFNRQYYQSQIQPELNSGKSINFLTACEVYLY